MVDQKLFILLFAIACFTLAHGTTKIDKKSNIKNVTPHRQGLAKSVETQEETDEGPVNEGDLKLDSQVGNKYSMESDPEDRAYLDHIDKMEKEWEEEEDDLLIEIASVELDSDEMIMLQGTGSRGLEAGDIFTAQDMLPIAVKLMERVQNKGKGKGIVSCEKNPKNLADNLYEKYFWKNCEIHLLNGETVSSQADDWCNLVETTDVNKVYKMKRIVILKDEDISGLDALQALALSGTVANKRTQDKYIQPETDLKEPKFADSKEFAPRRKSLYKLLTKPFYNKIRRISRRKPHHLSPEEMMKKLAKQRKLVVNPKRRRLATKIKNRKGRRGQRPNQRKRMARQGQNISGKKNKGGTKTTQFCRWKYGCQNQMVLESCKIHLDCSKDAKSKDYLGIKLLPHENLENLAQLRTMMGIDVIDAEVEKIFENRYNQQIFTKLGNIPRSESIADYFNNLIHFEDRGDESTTPSMFIEENPSDNTEPPSGEKVGEIAQLNAEASDTSDAIEVKEQKDEIETTDPSVQEVPVTEVSENEVSVTEDAAVEKRRNYLKFKKIQKI